MKTDKYKIIPIIIMIYICFVQPAYAKRFNKDNYNIDISIYEKKHKVKIWGRVWCDKKCNQLNLYINIINSVTNQTVQFIDKINNYRPKSSNKFNTNKKYAISPPKKFHIKVSKHSWYVDKYQLRCVE